MHREIDDLEQTKVAMVNETAREAIDLHIENLRREIRRLESENASNENRKLSNH
ncbi:antitoxin [Enterococcus hirae]|uniref:antitoxin n=1 Tax=Enterococcus hirae TaxID=1354 RepID=UPI000F8203BA|nr:antitoxin [Enterococcus hirae]